jgi:hypothetical protein
MFMKKISLYLSIFIFFSAASCQTEEGSIEDVQTSTPERLSWLKADLNSKFALEQKKVTSYLFDVQEIDELVSYKYVDHVRFVLGYANQVIQINAVGVDSFGNELINVSSKIFRNTSYEGELLKLKKAVDRKVTSKTEVSKHILTYKSSFDYVKEWEKKLIIGEDIENSVTYSGIRVQYFVLESGVIKEMIKAKNTAAIALFLGINKENKMTTVFASLDSKNHLFLTSETSKGTVIEEPVGLIFDFSSPCPPYNDVVNQI